MPGPYQIQAAIAAVHSDAPTAEQTDWRQILQLYDQLGAYLPTAVVALNRTVALAEVEGPAAALAEVDGSTSTATTCSTPPGPISSPGSSASLRPRRPTTGRSSSPATPPNEPSSRDGARPCRRAPETTARPPS